MFYANESMSSTTCRTGVMVVGFKVVFAMSVLVQVARRNYSKELVFAFKAILQLPSIIKSKLPMLLGFRL